MSHAHEGCYGPPVTINTFPDDVFREIFASHLSDCDPDEHMETWQSLVNVCQRWRQIIYGSPRYLDLHLHCSVRSMTDRAAPFRKNLSRWPEFPVTIDFTIHPEGDDDDLMAALEHPDRVHRVNLVIRGSDSGWVFDVLDEMLVPFPALTHLDLTGPESDDEDGDYELPNDFLGGSAPCLQHLHFDAVSLKNLPKLLLSARGLVSVKLENIAECGYCYISPKEMVGGLAGLTRLRTLSIKFPVPHDPCYPSKQPKWDPDPPMRADLPALTEFAFRGNDEYLENFLAKIDMPRIEDATIECIMPVVQVEVPQLSQFIGRSANLESAQFGRGRVTFDFYNASIELDRPQGECHQARFSLTITILEPELICLVERMTGVLGQLGALLYNVDRLFINGNNSKYGEDDGIESTKWLPLLHLFPAVRVLHISGESTQHFTSTLYLVATGSETATNVLPALKATCYEPSDPSLCTRSSVTRNRSQHTAQGRSR